MLPNRFLSVCCLFFTDSPCTEELLSLPVGLLFNVLDLQTFTHTTILFSVFILVSVFLRTSLYTTVYVFMSKSYRIKFFNSIPDSASTDVYIRSIWWILCKCIHRISIIRITGWIAKLFQRAAALVIIFLGWEHFDSLDCALQSAATIERFRQFLLQSVTVTIFIFLFKQKIFNWSKGN